MLSQDFVVGYGGRGLLRNNNAPRVPAAHLATEEARTPFCTDVHCYLYSRPNLYRDRERLLINALLSLNEGQRRFLLNSPAVPAPRPSPRGSSDFTVARDCASVYFTSPPPPPCYCARSCNGKWISRLPRSDRLSRSAYRWEIPFFFAPPNSAVVEYVLVFHVYFVMKYLRGN